MGSRIKGIIKGFKFLSQFFVYKEHEMEIGYPTDVKHISHIGWDGSSMNTPSWMNEFKTSSDFSSTSLSNLSKESNTAGITSWSSKDFQQPSGLEPVSGIFADCPPDLAKVPKKVKLKKSRDSSPPPPPRASRRSSKSKGCFSFDGAEGMSSLIDMMTHHEREETTLEFHKKK